MTTLWIDETASLNHKDCQSRICWKRQKYQPVNGIGLSLATSYTVDSGSERGEVDSQSLIRGIEMGLFLVKYPEMILVFYCVRFSMRLPIGSYRLRSHHAASFLSFSLEILRKFLHLSTRPYDTESRRNLLIDEWKTAAITVMLAYGAVIQTK